MAFKIISAGAGSGKTYCLTHEMVKLLATGEVQPSGIVATTFTNKAAAELQERVRVLLIEKGMTAEANLLPNALIGTVHSLGVRLLKRFAFEAGVSPAIDIIADEYQQVMFNQSLSMVLTQKKVEMMEKLADRLGMNKSEQYNYDWRAVLKQLTEVARANNFGPEVLNKSKTLSIQSFEKFLVLENQEQEKRPDFVSEFRDRKSFNQKLGELIEETISNLSKSGDETRKTSDAIKVLKDFLVDLEFRGELHWYQWAKISKLSVSVKNQELLKPLQDFADSHIVHPSFRSDISTFISAVFDLSVDAMQEYERYKTIRGLIDYTDMEVAVRNLLDNKNIQRILTDEIDLLMVDEFQDTNPIQLDIFLKLSRFAKHSIWVGDPKQSIYGFRGAEPALMEAIIRKQGGLRKENILEDSWRSRPDIVYFTNAVFIKAFPGLAEEQIILHPKRKEFEPLGSHYGKPMKALHHWHFVHESEGRTNADWFDRCLAETIKRKLDEGFLILPKGSEEARLAQAGDLGVFCRSNSECVRMAAALGKAGLLSAISQSGLLSTAEARLILACLKFILNRNDSLSLAEILVLAARMSPGEMIESRFHFLENLSENVRPHHWEAQNEYISKINELRKQVLELSSSEILALIIEELDIRRLAATWGNADQRLANIDEFFHWSEEYEKACSRLYSAASLGGFLLWIADLERKEGDKQGGGENPNAVNILTYHKSKGLEYPVVVCHSLESKLRAELWGLEIEHEVEKIDLHDILGNRWVRFWVNPYADQYRNTLLANRMDESKEKALKTKSALEEEARLMYVGLTRARDYLILPTRKNEPGWINRVVNEGSENSSTLSSEDDSYFTWRDHQVVLKLQEFTFPDEFEDGHIDAVTYPFLERQLGKKAHPPAQVSHKDFVLAGTTLTIADEITYGQAMVINDTAHANLIRHFFLADNLKLTAELRSNIYEGLCQSIPVSVNLFAKQELLENSSEFQNWMSSKANELYPGFPLRIFAGQKNHEVVVDFLLKDEDKVHLIFFFENKVEPGQELSKIKEKAAFLTIAREAALVYFTSCNLYLWVNLISQGKLVGLCFD